VHNEYLHGSKFHCEQTFLDIFITWAPHLPIQIGNRLLILGGIFFLKSSPPFSPPSAFWVRGEQGRVWPFCEKALWFDTNFFS
jgi:hypothetical protein